MVASSRLGHVTSGKKTVFSWVLVDCIILHTGILGEWYVIYGWFRDW